MVCVGTVYRPYVTVIQLRENRWSALSFQIHKEGGLCGLVTLPRPVDQIQEPEKSLLSHGRLLQKGRGAFRSRRKLCLSWDSQILFPVPYSTLRAVGTLAQRCHLPRHEAGWAGGPSTQAGNRIPAGRGHIKRPSLPHCRTNCI